LKSAMDKWETFQRLSGFERGVAIEAGVALPVTWAGLRLAGFRRWKSVLARLASCPVENSTATPLLEGARTIARMEAAAARNVLFHPTCLERSLVLWWLLRSRGILAELCVGARKDGERFEAHAWVEVDGAILNDPGEPHVHFVPFDGPITPVETSSP